MDDAKPAILFSPSYELSKCLDNALSRRISSVNGSYILQVFTPLKARDIESIKSTINP